MLGTRAYEMAYAYGNYKDAVDHLDLITAFSEDIEHVQRNYDTYGFSRRKKIFEPTDKEELNCHEIAFQFERGIDIAYDHLCTFLITPLEISNVQAIYNKRNLKWPDSSANRLEQKIKNSRNIVRWFQDQYKLELRRSYRFENNAIYLGNGTYVELPHGKIYTLVAELLFKDIQRVWAETDLIDAVATAKGISHYTLEHEALFNVSVKRICQNINDKISKVTNTKTRLVIYAEHEVRLDLMLFHIIDRVASK